VELNRFSASLIGETSPAQRRVQNEHADQFPRALRGGRIFAQAQSPEQMFGELRTAVSGFIERGNERFSNMEAAINSIANGRGFDGKILRTRHRSSPDARCRMPLVRKCTLLVVEAIRRMFDCHRFTVFASWELPRYIAAKR
jgi:hypothetical protein